VAKSFLSSVKAFEGNDDGLSHRDACYVARPSVPLVR
jgi:hypothetical protein